MATVRRGHWQDQGPTNKQAASSCVLVCCSATKTTSLPTLLCSSSVPSMCGSSPSLSAALCGHKPWAPCAATLLRDACTCRLSPALEESVCVRARERERAEETLLPTAFPAVQPYFPLLLSLFPLSIGGDTALGPCFLFLGLPGPRLDKLLLFSSCFSLKRNHRLGC